MYPFLTFLAFFLTAFEMHRRALADRRAAREFEKALTIEVAQRLEKLTLRMEADRGVQAAALENFLKQIREMVRFSEERRRELEIRLAGKKLP